MYAAASASWTYAPAADTMLAELARLGLFSLVTLK
jgi:hypothetical protein